MITYKALRKGGFYMKKIAFVVIFVLFTCNCGSVCGRIAFGSDEGSAQTLWSSAKRDFRCNNEYSYIKNQNTRPELPQEHWQYVKFMKVAAKRRGGERFRSQLEQGRKLGIVDWTSHVKVRTSRAERNITGF